MVNYTVSNSPPALINNHITIMDLYAQSPLISIHQNERQKR